MKIRISNRWNKVENSYDKALYDIRESEKTISGRFVISKKNGEKWVNKHMAFIAFKSDLDTQSLNALINHSGNPLLVSGDLSIDARNETDHEGYFRFVIKEAKFVDNKKEGPARSFHEKSEPEGDDDIPF